MTETSPISKEKMEEDDYSYGSDVGSEPIDLSVQLPSFTSKNEELSLEGEQFMNIIDNTFKKFDTQSRKSTSNEVNESVSINPEDSLLELRQRNQNLWKEIGYDPNNGKGDMRMSYTLNSISKDILKTIHGIGISPNKSSNSIAKLSNSTENEQGSESESFLPCPVLKQSRSLFQKPRLPHVASNHDFSIKKSIEDEEDPSSHMDIALLLAPSNAPGFVPEDNILTQYDSDSVIKNEEEENIENDADESDKLQAAQNIKKLINLNQALEKPQIKEHKLEPQNQTNNVGSNSQKLKITQKALSTNTSKTIQADQIYPSYDDENISGNEEENAFENSSSLKVVNQQDIDSQKPNQSITPRKRISKKIIDLSAYDDDSFDGESAIKRLPKNLPQMIVHPFASIIFRALCGEPMLPYPPKVLKIVRNELKNYLDSCINLGLIEESKYVQTQIDEVSEIINENFSSKNDQSLQNIDDQYEMIQEEIYARKRKWKSQISVLESEREIAFKDMEYKYQQEMDDLNEYWNSEKVQQKYNKPSAKLISMRQHARALLQAHEFDEASLLAKQISQQEKEETKIATNKMNLAYKNAMEKLKIKYQNEFETLKEQYESRKAKIEAKEQTDMLQPTRRLQILEKQKEEMKANPNGNDKISQTTKSKKIYSQNIHHNVRCSAPVHVNDKLKLPTLPPLNETLKAQK